MANANESSGQFHAVITATLSILANMVVVVVRRGGKRGERENGANLPICRQSTSHSAVQDCKVRSHHGTEAGYIIIHTCETELESIDKPGFDLM